MEESKFASKTELVDDDGKKFGVTFSKGAVNSGRSSIFIIAAVCIIALACLCAGIALMAKTKTCEVKDESGTAASKAWKAQCDYSSEANKIGLGAFLKKIKDQFYKLRPENTAWHPKANADKIRQEYRAYDPTPAKIKERTDVAISLLKEINAKVSRSCQHL